MARSTQLLTQRNEQLVNSFDQLLKTKYTHGPMSDRVNCTLHELAEQFYISAKRVKAIISSK